MPTYAYVIHIMFYHCEYARHCNQIWLRTTWPILNPKLLKWFNVNTNAPMLLNSCYCNKISTIETAAHAMPMVASQIAQSVYDWYNIAIRISINSDNIAKGKIVYLGWIAFLTITTCMVKIKTLSEVVYVKQTALDSRQNTVKPMIYDAALKASNLLIT